MSELPNPIEEPRDGEPAPIGAQELPLPEPAPEEPVPSTAPAEETLSDRVKMRKEFWSGFWACLILNGLAGCFYSFGIFSAFWNSYLTGYDRFIKSDLPGFGIIWLAVNLFVLVVLAVTRRKIFEGVVAGVATAFLISLLAGVCLTVFCFSQ